MVSEIEDGGPAFPSKNANGFIGVGISVRDYFAARFPMTFIEFIQAHGFENFSALEQSEDDSRLDNLMTEFALLRYEYAREMMYARS